MLFASESESVKVKVIQLCPTLWNLMNYTVHGILQARILECVALPFSRDSNCAFDFEVNLMVQDKNFLS